MHAAIWLDGRELRASNVAHALHACSRDMGYTPHTRALQYLLSDLRQMKDQGVWLRGQHPAATSAAAGMPRALMQGVPPPA